MGSLVLFLLDLEVFLFGYGSGWIGFSHLFFSSFVVASGLVWDLGPACLWPGGKILQNVHIRGMLYI
jgi:hypothetical protein